MKRLLPYLLLLPYIAFAVYSYAQVDPNLVISTNSVYWNFQQSMWQLGYHQRELSTQIYVALIAGMFISYVVALKMFWKTPAKMMMVLVGAVCLLVLAYNALSHDLFNYMFNAKMVVKYQMDPHVHVAMEIPSDVWVRFMNNIHTAAPYGYGWTALSLVPYSVGLNSFKPTFFAFKLFAVLGFFLLYVVQRRMAKHLGDKEFTWKQWLFFLNPLVLVELIGNVHNDVWMMLPYFISVLFLLRYSDEKSAKKKTTTLLISILSFAASASVKFATVAALPVYGLMLVSSKLPKKTAAFIRTYWADLSAICMMLPLVTARSQQFHPWYLIWSLSFLPFVRSVKLRLLLIGLSVSSMLRYIPYLSSGGYTPESLAMERQITWLGGLLAFLLLWGATRLTKRSSMLE